MRLEFVWLLLSTALFGAAILWVAAELRSGRRGRFPGNVVLMAGGFLAQSAFLGIRGQEVGRCPISTPSEVLVFVAWSAVGMYFLAGRPLRLSLLGMFIAPLVVVFHLVALPDLMAMPVRKPSGDFWLEMHASVSLLAFGAFALACIAGVMFLLQDRMLRTGKLGGLSAALPPVTNLSHSIVRLVGAGVSMLSIGILSAIGMQKPPGALHLALSLFVWLVYASLWTGRLWGALPNTRMAWCAIGSFLLPVTWLGLMEH
jgi:ABC-type uncharacterized transport system permease subunit